MPAARSIIWFFYCAFAISNSARSQQPELILPVGHTEDIFLTEYSSDGKYIITCAYDNTARLWDAYSGKLLHTFPNLLHNPDHNINTLISKDRKYLIAQTTDGYLKKWELPSAKLIFSFKQSTIPIAGFELSADGKLILIKTGLYTVSSPSVVVLDASNGRFLYTLVTVTRGSYTERNAELSPDGKFILHQADSSLSLHLAATGMLVRKLESLENFRMYTFSPDGKYIILFPRRSNQVRLWGTLDGDLRPVSVSGSIVLSPDSRYILSTSEGSLRLSKTESGEIVRVFETSSSRMMQGHFSPDGKYVFLSRSRGFIRGTDPYDSVTQIWETESGRRLYALNGKNRDINYVEFSPDNKFIATVAGDTRIWETTTGSLLNILEGREVRFSPDGRTAAVTDQRKVRVFSMALNDTLAVLKGYSNSITRAVFSPDGLQVLTLSNEKNAKLWDISRGMILKTIEDKSVIRDAVFSQDGKKLLIKTDSGKVTLLNMISGETVFTPEEKEIHTACFLPGGERIMVTADSSVYLYDVLSGKKSNRFAEHYSITAAGVSKDGKYLYYVFGKSALAVVDLATGKIFRDYLGEEEITGCDFSPDSKYILLLGESGTARLFETATGRRKEEFSKRSDVEYGIPRIGGYYYQNLWESRFQYFSPDSRYLVFRTYFDNYIVVRRMSDLAVLDSIFSERGFNNLITDAAFIPSADHLVTCSRDDTVRIWKYDKNKFRIIKKIPANGFEVSPDGKWLLLINNVQLVFYDLQKQRTRFSMLAINETDFFTQLAGKPYYAASRNAARNLGFRMGNQYFSFDQFDLQLNRPDIILSGIDNTDTVLISSYKNAWNKRIKRSGFRAKELSGRIHLPVLKLNGAEPYGITHESALTIRFTASDNLYNLDRYTISVNEVPLGGVKGYSLKELKTRKITKEIQVPLSVGKNSISISCVNEKGDESFKTNLLLTFQPLTVLPEPRAFFFGIGIDQYSDVKQNLQYSVKDIRDLSVKLKEKYKDNIFIDTLFNEQVRVSHVKALKQKLQQTTVNDKVIIAYSGHGLLNKSFDYYLSTYDVHFEQPEKKGLSYDELENLLDGIPARRKLLLIDACHSGEVDKDELMRIDAVDTSRLKKGTRPVALKPNRSHLGMKNSFELMQSLFVNVGKSTGATIISAAAGTQFALERGDLKNGVFTYSILEAMDKNPMMKISELKKIVGERVEQLTNGLQKPTSRNETIAVDWSLW